MKIHERSFAAHLCEAIGHGDYDGFLQAEHIAEVGRTIAEHGQLGRTGIAEHRAQSKFAQQCERGLTYGRLAHQKRITTLPKWPLCSRCRYAAGASSKPKT